MRRSPAEELVFVCMLNRKRYLSILMASGLTGLAAQKLAVWADGGDGSVFAILTGGPPEFGLRSVVAIVSYGIATSCLGMVLGLALIAGREMMPGGRYPLEPEIGCLFLLAKFLVVGGILSFIALCIWQFMASR
ncbi:MAG TPA: hypothetical protein VGM86_22295 [Thermoanaerobaculia bacterium]|jgi:hypothetical protein